MDAYLGIIGAIDFNVTARLFSNYARLQNAKCKRLHLLIESTGGDIPFNAFSLLRRGAISVTTYNMSSIQSGATMLYAAGSVRCAQPGSHFMVHQARRMFRGEIGFTKADADALSRHIDMDNKQMLAALGTVYEVDMARYWTTDAHYTGEEALALGLVTEFSAFNPPSGAQFAWV